MKVFSLALSKLLVSLQFPKFVILNPHQTTDPFLFFLHYPKCLKNFYIKESTPFSTQNNAIAKRQYGFRTNHSTDLAITTLYDKYINNIDEHLTTCSLFLDLSKAFDRSDHEILLQKLYHYGIRGNRHKLFCSYLSNKKQCT